MKAREFRVGDYLKTKAGTVCQVCPGVNPAYVRVTWWRDDYLSGGVIYADEEVTAATREEWLATFSQTGSNEDWLATFGATR